MIKALWGSLGLYAKIGIMVAALTAVVSAVAVFGHIQYSKGVAACQQQYAEQEALYQKNKVKQTTKKANETLKQETDLSKQLGKLQSDKERAINDIRSKADEAGVPDSCVLPDSIVRDLQEAVHQ